MNSKQKKTLARIIISAVSLIALYFVPVSGIIKLILYLCLYAFIGWDIIYKAVRGIFFGRVFDENFLMTVATIGAFALAIWQKSDEYTEGIAVMLFYQTGELFQSLAVRKSRKNIASLMDIRPDYANIEVDNKLVRTDPEKVKTGTLIVVNPGERIPIDGVVTEGTSTLDTSALTGESEPAEAEIGNEVISGCINMTGVLKIRTTKMFGESTVSRILDMVENASSRKSKSEAFISRFAKIYTPAVCFSALALAVLPPLVKIIAGFSAEWQTWIYRALIFLVVSCPCALVVSVPLSFFAGIGGAGREGILIKGSNYLEALANAKYFVFDKTGTLTKGVFEVSAVHHNKLEEKKIIEYAALAECASSHPISQSLKKAYGAEPDRSRVKDIKEISGQGIIALVDSDKVAVGNKKLMESLSVPYHDCHYVGTVIHIAINGEYAGHILITDVVKPNSEQAIKELKNSGIKKCIMLTGDRQKVADSVGKELSVDEIHAELLPEDKVSQLENVFSSLDKKEKVAFVGDGINDAPVLTRADIGIAMGAMGSDAAIEAADVVLMDDDPLKIAKAVKISKKCINIVKQNIVFALAVKLLCLVLGAFGYAGMWLAIFADVGVMVLAVLNAIRAFRVSKL